MHSWLTWMQTNNCLEWNNVSYETNYIYNNITYVTLNENRLTWLQNSDMQNKDVTCVNFSWISGLPEFQQLILTWNAVTYVTFNIVNVTNLNLPQSLIMASFWTSWCEKKVSPLSCQFGYCKKSESYFCEKSWVRRICNRDAVTYVTCYILNSFSMLWMKPTCVSHHIMF